MQKQSNQLHKWRLASTPEEWEALAKLANTSVGYLNQIAYGNRNPSPTKATEIELATRKFNKPFVSKESLVFQQSKTAA